MKGVPQPRPEVDLSAYSLPQEVLLQALGDFRDHREGHVRLKESDFQLIEVAIEDLLPDTLPGLLRDNLSQLLRGLLPPSREFLFEPLKHSAPPLSPGHPRRPSGPRGSNR